MEIIDERIKVLKSNRFKHRNPSKEILGWWELKPTKRVIFYAEPDRSIYTMNILVHNRNFLIDKHSLVEEVFKIYTDFNKFIKDSQQTIFTI